MRKGPAFYCQLDYESVPYPSPTSPNGNLADNGCGVCAASMLIENMLGVPFPPEESAALAKACGAREGYGTDLYIYSKALAERFHLGLADTEDVEEAMAFLRTKKGMVIANVRGNRDGYIGVFSDSGHYILVLDAEGDEIAVLDSCYRPGRFDIPGRAGKVRMEGSVAHSTKDVLKNDCFERPFFLFSRPDGEEKVTIHPAGAW